MIVVGDFNMSPENECESQKLNYMNYIYQHGTQCKVSLLKWELFNLWPDLFSMLHGEVNVEAREL